MNDNIFTGLLLRINNEVMGNREALLQGDILEKMTG
jgi:hypothetical protein